ncbi:BaiN/RdsA family NAD(P)/FAD-dependent oxidoreductase [Halocola ammonii]
MKIVIAGGGAAGFFTAVNVAEKNPQAQIHIYEKSSSVLGKVKVSGGGRCNVTHACFDPKELAEHYPRGGTELLGPFHKFQPGDTMGWYEDRGVELKIEDDNRVFPVSNSSESIIHCLRESARQADVQVHFKEGITNISKEETGWKVTTSGRAEIAADVVVMTTGSSNQVWKMLEKLGHKVVEPVPSLFTFNCKDFRINELAGVVAQNTDVKILGTKLESDGPLLITHWGFSAPAILKLSAWGARELADMGYKFELEVNWNNHFDFDSMVDKLKSLRQEEGKKKLSKLNPAELPARLWDKLLNSVFSEEMPNWGDLPNKKIDELAETLCKCRFQINGKSTFKEEFVTAGGVALEEVDFTTMESKLYPGLYFAGEVLNIDAVTGGFNFQAAWTESWLISEALTETE